MLRALRRHPSIIGWRRSACVGRSNDGARQRHSSSLHSWFRPAPRFTDRMRYTVSVVVACLAVTAGLLSAQPSQSAADFPFGRYPAHVTFSGRRLASVNLSSDTAARRFRTVLREGAKSGPNFAGEYTIVTWGCGTECRQLAIVSARTGAVYIAPFSVEDALHFRRSSELVVVDPYACGFTEAELPGPRWRDLYRWTGATLILIDSLRVPPGHAC
jgi:hypothetical protein